MGYLPKSVKSNGSVPGTILLCVTVSILATLMGTAIASFLINHEIIPEAAVTYAAMIIVMASSYLGAMFGIRKEKGERLVIAAIFALFYFLALIGIAALFFDGK